MRRAIRHGHRLGIDELFFHEARSERVVDVMGEAYPQLRETAALLIADLCHAGRGAAISAHLAERGLDRLAQERGVAGTATRSRAGSFPARSRSDLYKTYGFPLDLQVR